MWLIIPDSKSFKRALLQHFCCFFYIVLLVYISKYCKLSRICNWTELSSVSALWTALSSVHFCAEKFIFFPVLFFTKWNCSESLPIFQTRHIQEGHSDLAFFPEVTTVAYFQSWLTIKQSLIQIVQCYVHSKAVRYFSSVLPLPCVLWRHLWLCQ